MISTITITKLDSMLSFLTSLTVRQIHLLQLYFLSTQSLLGPTERQEFFMQNIAAKYQNSLQEPTIRNVRTLRQRLQQQQ